MLLAPIDETETATETVGDFIARYLAEIGVRTIFGVISIHNMPILDAVARQGRIRFVPARGEAGAMNMADAYARVTGGLGVCMTSTGTAAGNAAGAQAEALTAGSPVLHITTQVDLEFADRDRAAIHDVPRQPEMLRGVSKAVFRMWDANGAIGALTAAVSAALSAPAGPVSLEIPVDVQRTTARGATRIHAPRPTRPTAPDAVIDEIAELVRQARRPLLWLGGGARGAGAEAAELLRRGFGVVTSTNGRAIVSEEEPGNLGAFNMTPEAAELYATCDLMIVAGSRLRGNETRNNQMPLPRRLIQIDADAAQGGRNYPVEIFAHGDAADSLRRLLDRLPARLDTDPDLPFDIARTRVLSEGRMRDQLGPYGAVADALAERVAAGRHPWVRDVTISNSTFGNRYVRIAEPRHGVHALGGGIGQGVAMGIGAALGGEAKAITLLGDGGTMLGLAEMITAVDENAPVVYVLMNDQAYGVIQNIQDAQYDSRRHYSKIAVPDFAGFCRSIGMPHAVVRDVADFPAALDAALAAAGPQVVEVDMIAIGPFAQSFSGPPAGAAGNKV
ncbi:thiamine pyrophosphate-binding protein [Ruixingdingia sedimenti]|uniref:Thiamine pyrophosphate-binding protein n=1 Tax=Ruixingdingia sedimenti TaxID=3073604 RepID=A0ABU1FBE4_9RHOB|nr:thiamine pyrophosphate-binding protein [Xinfangfangia sp. LG-4]MDR5654200.1 thiamine pyrophosphate-binding protein [Xinfangfangia sp. LG-4]